MSLKNYTTSIKTEKTIGEIQAMLARHGAQSIMTEYEDGIVSTVSFRIEWRNQPVHFRLPANIDGVLCVLQNDRKIKPYMRTKEQASRVAWRIVKDWVDAQLAIVEADMVEMAEVFLPYAVDSKGVTLFQRVKDSPKLLEG